MTKPDEKFISVDVETSGPHPGEYAMLSIGACTLDVPRQDFYIELKPTTLNYRPESMEVSGLSLDKLNETGIPVTEAMTQFAAWIRLVTPEDRLPVFVAFNAPFDWMFVNEYFHRTLGYNPFGHSALDIKALYMGARKTKWSETTYNQIIKSIGMNSPLSHHALEDAIQQAELFKLLLEELEGK